MKKFAYLSLAFTAIGTAFAAPLQNHQSGGDEHIVIIDSSHPSPPHAHEVLNRLALSPSHPDVVHVFNNSAFRGFSASMKSHCLDLLGGMTDIAVVEKAKTISHASLPVRSGPSRSTRLNAPWGLQRISTSVAVQGVPTAMTYNYTYADSELGKGVDIYIIDTGVYTDHNVLKGRADMVWSFDPNDMNDHDGHGTHVSGTAAGQILGVASQASIHGLKALGANGGGSSSNVIASIDFVIRAHDEKKANPDFKGSVISMSLASSGVVQSIDTAVQAAVKAGIHTCVAAGNSGEDACTASPAASGGKNGATITVGSVDINAKPSWFTNHGSCVDVYAPGEDVISSWIGAPNMVNSLSGTSMATPHVTGVIAYAMSNKTLAQCPTLMKEYILGNALSIGDGILLLNNGVQAGQR